MPRGFVRRAPCWRASRPSATPCLQRPSPLPPRRTVCLPPKSVQHQPFVPLPPPTPAVTIPSEDPLYRMKRDKLAEQGLSTQQARRGSQEQRGARRSVPRCHRS